MLTWAPSMWNWVTFFNCQNEGNALRPDTFVGTPWTAIDRAGVCLGVVRVCQMGRVSYFRLGRYPVGRWVGRLVGWGGSTLGRRRSERPFTPDGSITPANPLKPPDLPAATKPRPASTHSPPPISLPCDPRPLRLRENMVHSWCFIITFFLLFCVKYEIVFALKILHGHINYFYKFLIGFEALYWLNKCQRFFYFLANRSLKEW